MVPTGRSTRDVGYELSSFPFEVVSWTGFTPVSGSAAGCDARRPYGVS